MDEFERWFLVFYTIYFIVALVALAWTGQPAVPSDQSYQRKRRG
jgi:hypothetical protein